MTNYTPIVLDQGVSVSKNDEPQVTVSSLFKCDSASKLLLIKFLSKESEKKLVDINMVKVIFQQTKMEPETLKLRIQNIKDLFLFDGECMYWYKSWNRRIVLKRGSDKKSTLKFSGYVGKKCEYEDYLDFKEDYIREDVLSMSHSGELQWWKDPCENKTFDSDHVSSEMMMYDEPYWFQAFAVKDIDNVWDSHMFPLLMKMYQDDSDIFE
jgi:hypothetical protein